MIRAALPAIILFLAANPTSALGVCKNVPYSQKNCLRVLAYVGDQGLYFDGQAHGWDAGAVYGYLSDDTYCEGNWTSDGPLGMGLSTATCENGVSIEVLYT